MKRIMNKIMLLMLLTSIGIVSVTASPQIITIDVVPDNAGSVQVWKIIGYGTPSVHYDFIGSTKTLGKYTLDTKDMVSIIPYNEPLSQYKLINMCDMYDSKCIKGTYVGYLWDIPEWTVTAYYEIPADKEPPKITGIALGTSTSYIGDYINIMVSATDNVAVTKVLAESVQLTYNGNSWNGKIQVAYEGTHSINILAYDGVGNYVQDTSKSYTGKVKPTSTQPPTPTVTTTPVISFHITNLNLNDLGENWITVNTSTTGTGTLGIDIDEVRVTTKDILSTDTGFTTKFETTVGVHFVCAYDLNNAQNEIVCDSVDVKPPVTPIPTPTPTPTPNLGSGSTIIDSTKIVRTEFSPDSLYGRLYVDSAPNNATIYINNANMGLTPKEFDIKPGGHDIRISKIGYKDFTVKIIIIKGELKEVTTKLVLLNGTNSTIINESTNESTNDIITVSNKTNDALTLSNKETEQQNTPFNYSMAIFIILAAGLLGICLNMYSKSLKENKTLDTGDKSKDNLTEKIKKLFKK